MFDIVHFFQKFLLQAIASIKKDFVPIKKPYSAIVANEFNDYLHVCISTEDFFQAVVLKLSYI